MASLMGLAFLLAFELLLHCMSGFWCGDLFTIFLDGTAADRQERCSPADFLADAGRESVAAREESRLRLPRLGYAWTLQSV